MELTILGSGTITSPPERNPAGYLLKAENRILLLDAGPGILRQLKSLPIELTRINLILITHFHLDHCSDLLALLMARYLIQKESNKRLVIVGPQGLKGWFDSQAQWQGRWLHNALPVLIEWQGHDLQVDGWHILAEHTAHTANSLAFRIERQERSLFFSGDTDWQASLISLAKEADLALIECSLPAHLKQAGHLTPIETGTLAQKANVKHLIATHIYPENDTSDLQDRIAAYFNGPIIIAKDLMRLKT